MAVKKSEIYSALWASCDQLRGGMDASLYKDYVLSLLFIKYVSDKYADSDDFEPAIVIPKGGGFKGMVALKGQPDMGNNINKDIIAPLIASNSRLSATDFPDFNDSNKLGEGRALIERLTNLISIFERPELDFSKNRADDDDLLGDAYEYLMRNFATESGKSKGQFYTPSEVSRVIARVVGIRPDNATGNTTVYDPTCGSGSLLLKVASEANVRITIEGQEKDLTTAGLARMNMILHGFTSANIQNGNTLAAPKFLEGGHLRTYDYVVANPPFSDKTWTTGFNPNADIYERFAWGVPKPKQGDFAYLLHIIRSMNNSKGKGACILPHGVLFRGTEADIRAELIKSGYLKGIIGLPPNLFYGTGIPACIIVLDKENAQARRGVFMIDASRGFEKAGNKNRLRERDIHKIVDTFNNCVEVPKFSRMVPLDEIIGEKNDCNLNIPRYIDSSEPEDIHSIEAHIHGGIPVADIAALEPYWAVMPGLRGKLFASGNRPNSEDLRIDLSEIRQTIAGDAEFAALTVSVNGLFGEWKKDIRPLLAGISKQTRPKELIVTIGESILKAFADAPLLDHYAMYQHLMDLWADVMQDDCYFLVAEGWKAEPLVVRSKDKKGNEKMISWSCDLIPKRYMVARYFQAEQDALDEQQSQIDATQAEIDGLFSEYGDEDGLLENVSGKKAVELKYLESVTVACIADNPDKSKIYSELLARIDTGDAQKELKRLLKTYQKSLEQKLAKIDSVDNLSDEMRDAKVLFDLLELYDKLDAQKKKCKELDAELDARALAKYAELSEDEIKDLVIDDKWMATIKADLQTEIEQIAQALTGRVKVLAERYEKTLPQLEADVAELSEKVAGHLRMMGVVWE